MSKWKGGRPTAALTTDWMALDPTKPPSFIPLESKVQQQNQSNFGRAEGLEGMSEEGAKFCQFGLNGNPRDFLCSPLPPYLHSMIQFYPFLRSAVAVVQKQRESAAAVYYIPMHGPGKSLSRSSFPFPIPGCLSAMPRDLEKVFY